MSIAVRPLSQPPFPLERIEEMTRMMDSEGQITRTKKRAMLTPASEQAE